MSLYNYVISAFLVYYTYYFIGLTRKKNRVGVQQNNIETNNLRKIPVKSLEEQKKFLDLKHPKSEPYKFKWKDVPWFIVNLFCAILLFYAFNRVFIRFNVNFTLFWTILFVIVVPILINYILKKFNLEKSDILIMITGRS